MLSLKPRSSTFMARALGSTTYIYTEENVRDTLATTTQPYTFDGTNIVCPTMTAIKELCYAIWYKSTISNPNPNYQPNPDLPNYNPNPGGYTCNVGTLFDDLGKDLQFKLSSGVIVAKWRLVRQITPQVNPPLLNPGLSPVGTVGYVITYSSYGINPDRGEIDPPSVIRVG